VLLFVASCNHSEPPSSAAHPEVLVVANAASPVSLAIARYYAERRNVPAENVLALELPLADPSLVTRGSESVSREVFQREVQAKVADWLAADGHGAALRVIVTCQGVPLRVLDDVSGLPYDAQRAAAVDAELALLGTDQIGSAGFLASPNRYFGSDEPFAEWRKRHPQEGPSYVVGRLAGYPTPLDPATGVPVDVKALIDAAQADGPEGIFVVDEDPRQMYLGRGAANPVMLAPAAAALEALGLPVLHDVAPERVADVERIAGYTGWGSNDGAAGLSPYYGLVKGRLVPGRFTARAVVVDMVSTNARSFSEPPSYGQSLVADLVHLGAAGAAGHTDEPTLGAVARPALLLGAYARGVPAGEAFLRSIPYLGWMNAWIGDPLMQIARPRAGAADRDGDGIVDALDNCRDLPNPDQRDTDADGFGNVCDADLDGDGLVGAEEGNQRSDLALIARSKLSGLYVPDCDLDGDEKVDDADSERAGLFLGLPPGPSGRMP
jgi:uncharacterized protein (TIGR03790 family)